MTKRQQRVLRRKIMRNIVFEVLVLMVIWGAMIAFTMWATASTELR